MCELFGISSDHREWLNPYLSVLRGHSEHHPNGWGYEDFSGSGFYMVKEPKKASNSLLYSALLEQGVHASCALAHIRLATVGQEEYKNSHPFSIVTAGKRRLTLIHNGTILDYPELDRWFNVQDGDTDSERVLLRLGFLLDRAEKQAERSLTAEERFALFDAEICQMAKGNKLNLMLFDGETMYAHTNCRGTLFLLEKSGAIFIATVPLSDEDWQPFPFAQLIGLQDGRIVFSGTRHQNEYIHNEEDLKHFYLSYSYL